MMSWLQAVIEVTAVIVIGFAVSLLLLLIAQTLHPAVAVVAAILGMATFVWWIDR